MPAAAGRCFAFSKGGVSFIRFSSGYRSPFLKNSCRSAGRVVIFGKKCMVEENTHAAKGGGADSGHEKAEHDRDRGGGPRVGRPGRRAGYGHHFRRRGDR